MLNDVEHCESLSEILQAFRAGNLKLVDFFGNCKCGKSLLKAGIELRDTSEEGLKQRAEFERLAKLILNNGSSADDAKNLLLNIISLHGKSSLFGIESDQ